MKKPLLLFCLLCVVWGFKLNAQNLVPNGSFETLDPSGGCPMADSFYSGRPQYWTGYYPGTLDLSGDYFAPCAAVGGNYPGLNEAGCALPLDGKSYCGFLASAANVAAPSKESEYIMNRNIPLTAGQKYYVEFYVRNAGGTSWFPSSAYSRNIGAFFTLTPNTLPTGQINGLNNISITKPQIPNVFPAANYYTKTDGWQKISGYFTPSQTGTWTMVIGNFDPGMNHVISKSCPSIMASITTPDLQLKDSNTDVCNKYVAAYYFVDAVTIIPANQTPPITDLYVSGNHTLCSNSSTTYTVQNIPFGVTSSSWSVIPATLFSGATSGTGTSATLTPVSGVKGAATLYFTLNSSCGPILVPVTSLYVGTPGTVGSLNKNINNPPFCIGESQIVTINPVLGATDYSWTSNDPSILGVLGNGTSAGLEAVAVGSTSFSIVASNICGSSSKNYFSSISNCDGGGGGGGGVKYSVLAVYPNPTSSTLTLEVNDSPSADAHGLLDRPYQVIIMDKFSRKVISIESREKLLEIPVSHLPADIYYLNLLYKNTKTEKQILIKR